MHMVDRVLRIAACSLVLLGSAAMPASADSSTSPSGTLVVEPESDQPADMIGRGYFQLGLAGGEQQSVRLVVGNTSMETMTIRAYPVDGVQMSGGGIDFNTFKQAVVDAGTWVSLDTPNLELEPGESRRVTATIHVAPDAGPGDHVAGIAIEDAHPRPSSTDSQVVINVYFRRAVAVIVAVPGKRTTALGVDSVALSQDPQGNNAVVQVRNTGNTLVKAKGRLEIGGSQGAVTVQAFALATMLPGLGTGVVVPLTGVKLVKGTYNAHVTLESEDGQPLADWAGTVGFLMPLAQATATPARMVSLAPVTVPAAALAVKDQPASPPAAATLSDEDSAALTHQAGAVDSAWFWLLGIVALALVLMRTVSGTVVRRKRQPGT